MDGPASSLQSDMTIPAAPVTVLFVDHTANMGGGEIALLNLVRRLDPRKYRPVVVLFADGPLRARLTEAGVETHLLPLSGTVADARKDALGARSLLRLGDVVAVVGHVRRLARLIGRLGVGVVHTNSLKADIIGGLAARLAGVPLVWHVRDRIDADYLPASVARVFRYLCRLLPHAVIANSGATLETLRLRRKRNAEAIPSGVDLTSHARVVHDGTPTPAGDRNAGESGGDGVVVGPPPVQRQTPTGPVIGLIGRISPWKGQHVFLQAARWVADRFPDARFQIVGAALFAEGTYEAEVRQLVRTLGLADKVEFTGFRSDVGDVVAGLDVLVHASVLPEPFGQVVIEGMAAGKPVVATAGGGVLEVVLDGVTGLLVPMGDADAMAEAVCWLLANPGSAATMGALGAARVREHFTIENTAAKVERVYESLLRASPSAGGPAVGKPTPVQDRAGVAQRLVRRVLAYFVSRYAAAAVLTLVALALALTLRRTIGEHAPVTLVFLAAVAVASSRWGARVGGFATAASVFAMAYAVFAPAGTLWVGANDLPRVVLFSAVSGVVLSLNAMLRAATKRAESARAIAEAARARLELLSRVGTALGLEQDLGAGLRRVAHFANTRASDWCAIDLAAGAGAVRRAVAAHRAASRHDLARRLERAVPTAGSDHPAVRAVAQRTSSVVVSVQEWTSRLAVSPEEASELRDRLEGNHLLVVPLVTPTGAAGAITLGREPGSGPFDREAVGMAEDLAWQAALFLARTSPSEGTAGRPLAGARTLLAPTDHESLVGSPLSPVSTGQRAVLS